jgi:hypothetical protein
MVKGRNPVAAVLSSDSGSASSKPGREGPVSVMDFGENPWDDFNYRPIVDIVANKKSVYKWF